MRMRLFGCCLVAGLTGIALLSTATADDVKPPKGFVALFNGKDLSGWHGMTTFDPRKLAAMSEEDRAKQLEEWNKTIPEHWTVKDGILVNDGHGAYLTTDKEFGDFELLVEYKTVPEADSGIYLKSTPQVQIWDWTSEKSKKNGSDKGSGGLWNNSPGAPGKDPLVLADKPFGEWNKFRIVQVGSRTSVWLNDKLVVDNAIMENYFEKANKELKPEQRAPLFPKGSIQLQTHGGEISWRNIYLREIPADEANDILRKGNKAKGFKSVFNGKDFTGWQGAVENYEIVDGAIQCKAGHGGNLFTKDEYGNFVARVEFKLPPAGNNGLAIRYPGEGNPAYAGMTELQVLDTEHEKYAKLDPRQAHGSAYGMVAAHRGYLRPTGEWNYEEVTVDGSKIRVELNGTVILDTDIGPVTEFMGNQAHPGKELAKGFFGFAGHNDPVQFRRIEIMPLPDAAQQKPEEPKVAQATPPKPEVKPEAKPEAKQPEPKPAEAPADIAQGTYPSSVSSCCAPEVRCRVSRCDRRSLRRCRIPRRCCR